jgi:hypothetical protein
MSTDKKPEGLQPFVLAMPADFWWTVKVPVAVENDYKHASLDVLFKPLKQTQLDKMQGIGLAADERSPSDEDIARAVMKGWRLKAQDGQTDVPFTEENLANLLVVPLARTAIVATYFMVMRGIGARKNA